MKCPNKKDPYQYIRNFIWFVIKSDKTTSTYYGIKEGKSKLLLHKTPPNLATQKYATKNIETNTKRHSKFERPENWNLRRVSWTYQS